MFETCHPDFQQTNDKLVRTKVPLIFKTCKFENSNEQIYVDQTFRDNQFLWKITDIPAQAPSRNFLGLLQVASEILVFHQRQSGASFLKGITEFRHLRRDRAHIPERFC